MVHLSPLQAQCLFSSGCLMRPSWQWTTSSWQASLCRKASGATSKTWASSWGTHWKMSRKAVSLLGGLLLLNRIIAWIPIGLCVVVFYLQGYVCSSMSITWSYHQKVSVISFSILCLLSVSLSGDTKPCALDSLLVSWQRPLVLRSSYWTDIQVKGTSLPRALYCWDRSLNDNRNNKAPPRGCPVHLIDSCPWPHCNPTCPTIRNQFTGQEIDGVQFLKHMGFDVQKMAQQQGMDPGKLLGMLSSGS